MKKYLLLLLPFIPLFSYAQLKDGTFNTKAVSEKAISKIEKKFDWLSQSIDKKTLQVLSKLEKQENKLKHVLAVKDSLAASQLFNASDAYQTFSNKLKASVDLNTKSLKEYIPQLDSLQTSIKFLKQANSIKDKFPKEWSTKISDAGNSIEGLQTRLQQANEVKEFIKQRKQLLKDQLQKYGFAKQLKKFNKQAYYYQQQLSEYKSMLKDRKKIEQKAMAELHKLPAFTAFMKKNSQLASLFRLPDNDGTEQSLAGLQTRAAVQSQVMARFASSGVNQQQYIGQQMQAATAELNKVKDKLNNLGGGSSDMEMPDFKPNTQRTKSFLKRIEWGANVQSQKTNRFLPVTSDFALTAGYKLNDKSVIGIGASYKLGWGSGWQHIKLTNQGVGLRSYMDVKLKGSFWMSGGYEQNYQKAFAQIDQLKEYSDWQTSGLIGLSKKYKIGKKTNNLQLLWDFVSYRQVPRRQPVLFRIGYVF